MAQFAVYSGGEGNGLYSVQGIFDEEGNAQQYAHLDNIGNLNRGLNMDYRVAPAEDGFEFPGIASNEEINEIVREYNHLFPQ